MTPSQIQTTLAALDAVDPPRGLFGKPIDPGLLATVRAAVHGPWPPVAASPIPAIAATATPARPAAAAPIPRIANDPTRAGAAVAADPKAEEIDWGAIVDELNAKAGLQRGPNPSSIYAARRAAAAGLPSTAGTSSSHGQYGVDPGAVYASRREQAAAASGDIDWSAIVAAENAKLPPGAIIPGAARSSGVDPSSVYAGRHAQTDAGCAGHRRTDSGDQGATVPKLTADPARTAAFRSAYQTYAARRAQTGETR